MSNIFWYAQSGAQAVSFRKHPLARQMATLNNMCRCARASHNPIVQIYNSSCSYKKMQGWLTWLYGQKTFTFLGGGGSRIAMFLPP